MAVWYESTALMTLLGALVGALGGALGTTVVTKMNNTAAERRHIMDLAYKAATEEYQRIIELSKDNPHIGQIPPFFTYIVHHYIFINQLLYGKCNTDELVLERLKKVRAQTRTVGEWVYADADAGEEDGGRQETQP